MASNQSPSNVPPGPRRKWLLVFVVAVSACGLLAAALRDRPKIDLAAESRKFESDFEVAECVNQINLQTAEQIAKKRLDAAPLADPLTVCRRLNLALVGNSLSLEEVRAIQAVPPERQIDWWTAHLLQDRRWADYFAERLARACVGTNRGAFIVFRRRIFNQWLGDELQAGTGWDKIVQKMVASNGLWTDTPETNFVTATLDEGNNGRADAVRLAGRTSRAFLAMRIDCLQCHDDVLDKTNFGSLEEPIKGTQSHFHSLAAFYSGTTLSQPPFRGIIEDGKAYDFQFLNTADTSTVEPNVPFQSELLPADGSPRERLATWLTHPNNRQFSRAIVNRVWALMFGIALVNPVDDIPLVGDVPPMLDTLADDFSKHHYDMRRLVRLIASTDAFRRSSKAAFEITPEHESVWAVFPLTQLRPDQIAASVIQACRLTTVNDDAPILSQLFAFGQEQEFVERFGDRGEDEFKWDAVTITQRLQMMNGDLIDEHTKVNPLFNGPTQIANLVRDNEEAIRSIFLSTLNRLPTQSETDLFLTKLQDKGGEDRTQVFCDMAWAILNSTEFSWNH